MNFNVFQVGLQKKLQMECFLIIQMKYKEKYKCHISQVHFDECKTTSTHRSNSDYCLTRLHGLRNVDMKTEVSMLSVACHHRSGK